MAESPPPGFATFTKTWHSTPYPFISPERPELSAKGKTIVITGAGTGISRAAAIAFAKAGAKYIAIIGRRADKLKATEEAILAAASGETTVLCVVVDLVDRSQTLAAFESIAKTTGKIDVLVSSANIPGETGPIATFTPENFMKVLEGNVITLLNAFQAFLPHLGPEPVLLSISSGFAHVAPWPNSGAYPISKAAAFKLTDYIAAENPQIRVVSVHPGWIPTDFNKYEKLAPDSVDLPASFFVWVASPEAAFLKNKYVWANWDAQELLERAEEIAGSRLLTGVLDGLPM